MFITCHFAFVSSYLYVHLIVESQGQAKFGFEKEQNVMCDQLLSKYARNREATIIDFVGTIIVWGIITVSRLLCIYSFHNKLHEHSLDIKVLFIAAFWNTITNKYSTK